MSFFIRRVDELGRIVLPIELRRALDIEERDAMRISLDGDRLILQKNIPSCIFCGAEDALLEYAGKRICRTCLQTLNEQNALDD